MSPLRKVLLTTVCLSLLSVGLAACSKDPGPGPSVDKFITGWRTGDFGDLTVIGTNGEVIGKAKVTEEIAALSGSLNDAKPVVLRGKVDIQGEDRATVELQVSQPIPGGTWEYVSSIAVFKHDTGGWRPIWEPTVVHPKLHLGDRMEARRTAQPRGTVFGGNGEELVKPRPVVGIGIWPAKIIGSKDKFVTDLAAALKPVHTVNNVAELTTRVNNPANADQFVEVVTLRREIYEQVRTEVRALGDGVRFIEEDRMLAETRGFASAVLGTVGPVTKEIMDANPGKYLASDLVGLGGVQQQFDQRLRGGGGVRVLAVRKAPDGSNQETELHSVAPTPGQPIKVSLDSRTQSAAEAALAAFPQRGAVVAIRVSDSTILATANKTDLNLAFTAQVPPGSTFKAVTALGLLDKGSVTADKIVPCPKFLNVPGRPTIQNSGQFELGNVPFSVDFYRSCNTAFASLAPQLGANGLAQAGSTVGLGQKWDLGVEVFSGTVSSGGDAGEQAAAAFGQGTTIVSPVAMAGVAAAIARGQWKQPRLVLDPAPAAPAPDGPALKASTVEPLRAMMRQVVTSGTATDLADVPNVYGKTGTAEYVTGDPTKPTRGSSDGRATSPSPSSWNRGSGPRTPRYRSPRPSFGRFNR